MSQKPTAEYEPPAGPPPPSYSAADANIAKPPNTFAKVEDAGPNPGMNAGGNYAPGPQMAYAQPPPGQYPPQQGYNNYPPPEGYYGGPQGNMYGQPAPYGAYAPGHPPPGQYVNDRGARPGGPGFADGLLAACACCCCLDLLF
ncbi:hypothetical protein K3495_g11771 [Podosphaera aphanis]|nr:hypothetical protein K3495_g11771 [Podosphaera aphanis]